MEDAVDSGGVDRSVVGQWMGREGGTGIHQ